jgi:hypothetical protein
MEHPKNAQDLKRAIVELSHRRDNEWLLIHLRSQAMGEALKPRTIVKDVFRDLLSNDSIKTGAIGLAMAIATGLIAKTILPAKSAGTVAKIVTGAITGIAAVRRLMNGATRH